MGQLDMGFFSLANIIIAGILIALVYKTRRYVPESYKSYSMFASIVSYLAIGLMLACILAAMVVFILNYADRVTEESSHGFNKTEDTMDDETLGTILDNMIVFEGALYCSVTTVLLGKWAMDKRFNTIVNKFMGISRAYGFIFMFKITVDKLFVRYVLCNDNKIKKFGA